MNKILVVYYSAQGHTQEIAEQIAKNLNADIYEITPKNIYTEADLNWMDESARATREFNDKTLRDVALSDINIPNWSEYDTIILGYPIWWGIAAWPTNSFVKAMDWNNKTIIPFCTSHSSGVGESDKLLKADANGGDWQECMRFYQDAPASAITKWTDTIK
ncbi:NAD(P)H-dependent oxidoreductase [Candidatus Saccharibacteria bacterium]|nr:NAD(P)H-dependent oxidoreductase [Candidatus Saccharibacteria bacterium]